MIYEILPVNNYQGNGSSTKFDFDFYIENESQLDVSLFNADGTKIKLELNVDYSINELKNPNGSYITFPIALSQHEVLTSEQKISLELTLPISQETQYNNSSLLNLKALEYSLDYLTRLIQILARKITRCIKVEECSDNSPDELLESINQAQINSQNQAALALQQANKASQILETTQNLVEKKLLVNEVLTNCITRTPKRIKYTLDNGFLTVKAGAVVTIPFGTEDLSEEYPIGSIFLNNALRVVETEFKDGKFFVLAELTQDKQMDATTQATGENRMVTFNATGGNLESIGSSAYRSGTIEPSGLSSYYRFYNTATNYIYNIGTEKRHSFPLLIGESINGKGWTNIKQLFENFGIIGSSVFMNKGVRGLISNGRNEDGTLKNIEFNPSSFVVRTYDGGSDGDYVIQLSNDALARILVSRYIESDNEPTGFTSGSVIWLNTKENIPYIKDFSSSTSQWTPQYRLNGAVIASFKDGIFTSLNVNEPFQAVGKSELANIGSPSNSFIPMTLGATGTIYTMPDSGYLCTIIAATESGQSITYAYVDVHPTNYNTSYQPITMFKNSSSAQSALMAPVRKGQRIKVSYDSSGEKRLFGLIPSVKN